MTDEPVFPSLLVNLQFHVHPPETLFPWQQSYPIHQQALLLLSSLRSMPLGMKNVYPVYSTLAPYSSPSTTFDMYSYNFLFMVLRHSSTDLTTVDLHLAFPSSPLGHPDCLH
ncbi:hypothetical protein L1887_31675 [Cichorium endivia]|nr:hypothetical protein L1887_31675 [Cichorium endivia]